MTEMSSAHYVFYCTCGKRVPIDVFKEFLPTVVDNNHPVFNGGQWPESMLAPCHRCGAHLRIDFHACNSQERPYAALISINHYRVKN